MSAPGLEIAITALTSDSGVPVSGAKVFTWIPDSNGAATASPRTVYTDPQCTVPAANPAIADAGGRITLYHKPSQSVVVVIKDANATAGTGTTYSTQYRSTNPLGALGDNWSEALTVTFPFFNVEAYGADESASAADNNVALLAAHQAARDAGGGTVIYPGRYEATETRFYSNCRYLGLIPNYSGVIAPSDIGATVRLGRNSTLTSYTNVNITFEDMCFDGNDAGAGGSQSRFIDLVALGRVTGLHFKGRVIFKNNQYQGVQIAGCRNVRGAIELYNCGYQGTTTNGGSALWMDSYGDDECENFDLSYYAEGCYWHGAQVGGSGIIRPRAYCVKEAGLFSTNPVFVAPYTETYGLTILDPDIDGVTEHDISGSGLELGGRNITVGPGHIRHVDHSCISMVNPQGVNIVGPTLGDWNQILTGAASSVDVISNLSAPNQPKHVNVRACRLQDQAKAVTVTFTNGSAVIGSTAHGLRHLDMVQLTTSGTLPTNFALSTNYFVSRTGQGIDTFQLSATRGGTPIVAGSAGSGTHTATKATNAYSNFGISGTGDAAEYVVFEGNDGGPHTPTGAQLTTTKFGTGCRARNNVRMNDYVPITTIASGVVVSIGGVDDDYIEVSGTNNISSFGAAAAGTRKIIRFTGTGNIVHNSTSMINKTGATITRAADDTCELLNIGGSNWLMLWYQEKNGTALA